MKISQLGTSDMWLTRIGLGAWAIGGGNTMMSWGPQDDNDSIAAIHKAIDLGVNWIDTAPAYGLGHSEEIVGRAVKESSVKPFIFTKCGIVWNEKSEIRRTLTEIRREIEDSLRRLQVEAIDLYQIHWPVAGEDLLQ
ncbi:MAG: aldo/keto reductase, partial [Acidobacteriota bacterium]|nr:aldo/keto reductase [Acidobacteriota bacterium]